jgi:hypothetical protein
MPDINTEDKQQVDEVTISNTSELGLKNDNEVFSGGADNSLKFLYPEDDQLINLDSIKQKVNEYVTNYHSATYTNYKKTFNQVYQKYSKKNYIILNTNDKITVYKTISSKEKLKTILPVGDKIFELNKPKYIHYSYEVFEQMKRDISNSRQILKQEYDNLVTKIDIQQEDKNVFDKHKEKYIKNLEKYYTYISYHNTINNITDTNIETILNQELVEVLQDNQDTKKALLEYESYKINKNLINDINKINSDRLNSYNDIINMIQILPNGKKDPRTTELKNKIKSYLDKKELDNYLKSLNTEIKHQQNYIYYIVDQLPAVLFEE